MEKMKLWIHISLFVILLIVTHGCVSVSRHSIVISRGFDYDSTYCIINDCNKDTIYDGGHNVIATDTLINGSIVFIEDIITEECSNRIIIYNLSQKRLYRAYNMSWYDNLSKEDLRRLLKGVEKSFVIEDLDIRNQELRIRYFNDSIALLRLERLE